MIWFGLVIFILGLVFAVLRLKTEDDELRDGYGIAKSIGIGVGAALCFISPISLVPAGHVGVPVLWGKVQMTTLGEGLNFVNPFVSVKKMSVRTQEIKESADVPSSEGLIVNTEASLLFSLVPSKAPEVYQTLGENYTEVFVEPQFRSHLRGITAGFEAKSLYTADRDVIENKLETALAPVLEARGIGKLDVLLRKVELPKLVSNAIEEKLKADQSAQQMAFVLQKEKQEAERKRIEAQGIADFQKIVTAGISEPLLKWKGIEATERLAASPNAKLVIVGGGQNGLPIILNADK